MLVAEVCKLFKIPSVEAAKVLVDFAVYKQANGAVIGKQLQKLLCLLEVLPISSADC